jgi:hypothetical protein
VNKIYERVKDLAIAYSSISHREVKRNTYEKFKSLVESEFKDYAIWTKEVLKKTSDPEKRRMREITKIRIKSFG